MKQFLLSLGSDKNHDRILKGVLVVSILLSITMLAAFLPGIFNR
ncbi:hypothetical protein [Paraburkholderia susongensis]|uniref:Uncharacterized protein n=1 Tax=Paraburkholderia susongensis TaxID=1515439 RepID=A0A1X7J9M3_9BURK|nr:hypothetical protein [Paraburkholderia susongensis]SMG24030.1 hypothetical protein SAMN06265784_102356 [Paraburkholderia susongensis]